MEELLHPVIRELDLKLPDYWSRLNAEPLKRIGRQWLGANGQKSGKQQILDALTRMFENPAQLDAFRRTLTPFQQAALGLLASRGGMMAAEELGAALLAHGHPYEEPKSSYLFGEYGLDDARRLAAVASLEEAGLVGGVYAPRAEADPTEAYLDVREFYLAAYSDPRLLRGCERLAPVPLPLEPLKGQHGGMLRRPAEVSLRLVGLVEALRRQSPIKLTTRGRPPKPVITKIAKGLNWDKSLGTDPHTPLPEPAHFFYRLIVGLQLIRRELEYGVMDPEAEVFLHLPYPLQARFWANAYVSLTGWAEYIPRGVWIGGEDLFRVTRFNGMRAALATALGALPDPDGWYDLAQFDHALYERIGHRYSLSHIPQYYEPYRSTAEQKEAAKREVEQRTKESWRANVSPFIQHALAGPLFHLGLVEVGYSQEVPEGLPDRFRLTPLGKTALYDALRPGGEQELAGLLQEASSGGPAWVVQPNFEMVAYLDRMTPASIGFLGKIAERKPSDGAVAVYRLTRETVYAALEGGLPLSAIIEGLERGAGQPLPSTVRRSLEDWAARRERIELHLQAEVLEYRDANLRDAALARQPSLGRALGDRFILVSQSPPSGALRGATVIDYLQPPVPCLGVTEEGHIDLDPDAADFLVRGELAQWADPDEADANRWRLSGASVGRAAQGGWTAEQIIGGLRTRSRHPLPALIQVAIQAWARKQRAKPLTGLAEALVLQFAEDQAAAAVFGSPLFRKYLSSRLGPRTFLVDPEKSEELSRLLAEFGLAPDSSLVALSMK